MKTFKKELEELTKFLKNIVNTPRCYNYDRDMIEDLEASRPWKNFIQAQADNLTASKMLDMLNSIEEINVERIYVFDYFGNTSAEKLYNLVEDFFSTYLIFIIRTFDFFDSGNDNVIFTNVEMLEKLKALLQDKKFEEEILNY